MTSNAIESLLQDSEKKELAGDLKGASAAISEALSLARNEPGEARFSQVLLRSATLAYRQGDYAGARLMAEEVLAKSQNSPDAVDALISIGIIEARTNELQAADKHFYEAAEISRAIQYPVGLARALHHQAAMIFYIEGKFTLALAAMDEAQLSMPENNGEIWELPFLQTLIYLTIGDRKRTRQALDAYLPIVRPGTRIAGGYYYLWSRLSLDEEELERAEEYLYLALRIANQSGSPDLNVWVRLEYSRLFRLRGEPATAHTWAEDAYRYAQRIQSAHASGQALAERARTSWEMGDHQQAFSKIDEAIQLFESVSADYELAYSWLLKAAWLAMEELAEAPEIWQQAINSILQGGYTFILERERKLAFPLMAHFIRSRNPAARQPAEALIQHMERITPPVLRIYGLGQFRVLQGRRPVNDSLWQRRKAGEMFRYLLLQPGHAASRDVILEELWPDHPLTTSQDLFHQATSTLRHILEPDLPDKFPSRYLAVEGERVFINLPPGSMIDFEHFEQELPIAIQSRQIGRLQEALALYTDDLFPMDLYLDWSASRRQELVDLYLNGLLVLGQAYLQQQRFDQAVNCAAKILQRDAWNEDATLLGMLSYIGQNSAPRAVNLYQKLEKTLKEDLDLQPRMDLREVIENIKRSRIDTSDKSA
jgi:DNA-binding SARP family transcriptional activator